VPTAPVKLYWLLLPLVTLAHVALVAWLLWREDGRWTVRGVVRRLRLNLPRLRVTGDPAPSRLWWILPWSVALMAAIVAGLLIIRFQVLLMPAAELMRMAGLPRALDPVLVPILSPRPEYAAPFALASPVFAGQWWWAIFIMAVWGCSACGEELVFRGVLLPATRRAFGRRRGVMNGLLFALYHVHRPWAIPFRAIEAIAIVRPAVAFSSTVMAIAIRGAEGIVVLALVLMAVLTPPFRTLSTPLELPTVTWHPAPARLGRGAIRELPPRNNAGGVDVGAVTCRRWTSARRPMRWAVPGSMTGRSGRARIRCPPISTRHASWKPGRRRGSESAGCTSRESPGCGSALASSIGRS
ncbi:MAG: CPBP family intramembrane metalloprotease, partial [Planctomycetes bacterium]|nr:CPBP family intramembrane metalloprotease [Planctomycetota bacterium]